MESDNKPKYCCKCSSKVVLTGRIGKNKVYQCLWCGLLQYEWRVKDGPIHTDR